MDTVTMKAAANPSDRTFSMTSEVDSDNMSGEEVVGDNVSNNDDSLSEGTNSGSHTSRDVGENMSITEEEEAERTESDTEDKNSPSPCHRKLFDRLKEIYRSNQLVILLIISILLARAYPPLGAVYLVPEITATWIAVAFIFLMTGLTMKTEELSKAICKQTRFNAFVQIFNFGFVSATVFGITRLLLISNILNQSLADGMIIAGSLPMTINTVVVLTRAADGDDAAAVFNAVFASLIGVFLSPVLIFGYLGVSTKAVATGGLDLVSVFYKLALRVLLPIAVGQVARNTCKSIVLFMQRRTRVFKFLQLAAFAYIVYTLFCRTFFENLSVPIGEILLMVVFVMSTSTFSMAIAWFSLKFLFREEPRLRVTGLYGCVQKSSAMGVPLINAMFETNPAVGLLTLPVLVWTTTHLILGSFLVPRLAAFVKRESERLGINDDEAEEFDLHSSISISESASAANPGVGEADTECLSQVEEARS